MPDPSEALLDKVFFLIAFIMFVFVAAKPESFIRGITLGRSSGADVSHVLLRTTQAIAGFAALAIAVWLVVGLFTKAR